MNEWEKWMDVELQADIIASQQNECTEGIDSATCIAINTQGLARNQKLEVNSSPNKNNNQNLSRSIQSSTCIGNSFCGLKGQQKKGKKKQLKVFDNVVVNYLDNYEVEAPNFDRKEVLHKIYEYYTKHEENIAPTIDKIVDFYQNQMVQSLLLKNQCEELIQQKTRYTALNKVKDKEIKSLFDNNLFLHHDLDIINPDQQFQKAPSTLVILTDFLSQQISMDSGLIIKQNSNNPDKKKSTVNMEKFVQQSKESDNYEKVNEKQQKFIFQCYLGLVEMVERVCMMIPLIEYKLDYIQQKMNIFFEFEFVPQQLLKHCSDLFSIATNGKSLEKEFQTINDCSSGGGGGVQQSLQLRPLVLSKATSTSYNQNFNMGQCISNTLSNNGASQNIRKSFQSQQMYPLISQFNPQMSQNNNASLNSVFTGMNKNSLFRDNSMKRMQTGSMNALNFQNLPNLPNLFPTISIMGGNSKNKKQTNFNSVLNLEEMANESYSVGSSKGPVSEDDMSERSVRDICKMIMKDWMAKYVLSEGFVQSYVKKQIQNVPQISDDEILIAIKAEALNILNEKLQTIFTSFSGIFQLIKVYIESMKKVFNDKHWDVRIAPFGSNQPPTIGGALSLPRNDFIINSYMKAYEKQINYQMNPDEDSLQKLARTTQNQNQSLLINTSTETKENQQKEVIYKFINDISHIRKNISKQYTPNLPQQNSKDPATFGNNSLQSPKDVVLYNNITISPPSQTELTLMSNINQQTSQSTNISNNNNNIPILDKNSQTKRNENVTNQLSSLCIDNEDYIEEERENVKRNERLEYEELQVREQREKLIRQQEERKNRIVYHRLIKNAETANSKQEQKAAKQFALDSDIIFKIHNLEKDMQTNIADTLCENIRLESNKMSNQFSKDFSKPTFGYLKSNTIQDRRKEIQSQERHRLRKIDSDNKNFFKLGESDSVKEPASESMISASCRRTLPAQNDERIKTPLLSSFIGDKINSKGRHHFHNPQTSSVKSPQQLKRDSQGKQDINVKANNSFSLRGYYASSIKSSSMSTQDYSHMFTSNVGNSQFQNTSLLVSNIPSSATTLPVYYKYLQPNWISTLQPQSSLKLPHESISTKSATNLSLSRKAFTSQSGTRQKIKQIYNNN